MKRLIALALCLASVCAAQALAQKKKTKEKRFEPVVRQNLRDYAGRYVGVDDSYWIEISVGDDGRLAAVSHEDGREAALTDIRLEGARLTATSVYRNGSRAEFVATFGDRVRDGVRTFGLTTESIRIELPGITLTRIFYRRVGE
ncbi:MAG: hypothetical protein QOF61_3447 [Acidobacteriota bacterium]|nr:hypothetical protein [Acidobacteriota bacterium]